ncbi:RagB/SusD family nutrient uptake outer membrane protein [Flavobacterium pallidum]|nr:RagB/SusD family nutrient uptake outer membrane protein [Flavobacterium pallidum]
MKKIVKTGLLLLLFGAVSCNDATDIIQDSELGDEAAFQTVADLQSGLYGAYSNYAPDAGGNGSGDAILLNDLFTDNLRKGHDNLGQGSTEYNFIIDPTTNQAESVWSSRYSTINSVNRVLRALDRIAPNLPVEDEVEIEGGEDVAIEDFPSAMKVKAQLLALRALSHLDLFEYYTVNYSNASDLSVIIMDHVPAIEDQLERNTVAEVLAFIKADLAEAASLIGEANQGDLSVNFINKNTIKAIQARLALVSGDYVLAGQLSAELVGDFPLAQPDTYTPMFSRSLGAGEAGELIFSLIRRPADSDIAANYYANGVSLAGNPFFEASQQLYDLYDLNGDGSSDDIRRDTNITKTQDVDGNDVYLITKYPGTALTPLANDVPIFRSSEFLLIRAEAEARAGNLIAAANSIKQLTDARYTADAPPTPVFGNVQQALTAILLERRKEFAFEGHRYLDLKRLGGELNIGVSRLDADAATFAAPKDLLANDHRFTLPIPQSELNGNNNITQNPGYTN